MKLLDELAEALNMLYYSTQDFFVLHGVTSARALKLVLPHLKPADQAHAVRGYLRGVISVYIVQNTPEFRTWNPEDYPVLSHITWEAIVASAVQSNDVHVIKYVYTVWREYRNHPNELYRFCAAKKVGLLESLMGEAAIVEPYQRKGTSNRWLLLVSGIAVATSIYFFNQHRQNTSFFERL